MTDRKKDGAVSAETDPYMSLSAAALALGESRNGILGRIARRELESAVSAGRAVVTRASVERAKQRKDEEAKAEKERQDAELSSRRASRVSR